MSLNCCTVEFKDAPGQPAKNPRLSPTNGDGHIFTRTPFLDEIPHSPRPANTYSIQGLGQTNVAWYGMIQWMATQLPNVEWVLPQAYVYQVHPPSFP